MVPLMRTYRANRRSGEVQPSGWTSNNSQTPAMGAIQTALTYHQDPGIIRTGAQPSAGSSLLPLPLTMWPMQIS